MAESCVGGFGVVEQLLFIGDVCVLTEFRQAATSGVYCAVSAQVEGEGSAGSRELRRSDPSAGLFCSLPSY